MSVSSSLGLLLFALLFYSLEGISREALPIERRPEIKIWVIEPSSLNPSFANDYTRFKEEFDRIFRVRLDVVVLDWYKLPTAILSACKSGSLPNISLVPTWMIPQLSSNSLLSEVTIGQRLSEQWNEKSLQRTKYLGKYWGVPFVSGNLRLFVNISFAANNGIEAFFPQGEDASISIENVASLSEFLTDNGVTNELLDPIVDNPYILALLMTTMKRETKASVLSAFRSLDTPVSISGPKKRSMFLGFGFLPDRARLNYTVHDFASEDNLICETFANVVFTSKSEEIDRIATGIVKMLTPKRMGINWNLDFEKEIVESPNIIIPNGISDFADRFRVAAAACLWLSRGMIPSKEITDKLNKR